MSLNGFTQKIISAENPLEEILQKDFDSSILYSYSNRGYYHNYLIISKKDSLVYFYRYSSLLNSYLNFRDRAPYNSNIRSKLDSNYIEFITTKPNINSYFSWVDTKLASESIWKDISKYNLWNFIDDSKIDSLVNTCDEITYDSGYEVFKLLTKNKIIELIYDDPYGKIKNCKFNQTRADIIKIQEIISEFFKSK
jgi:hypothetical protein